MLLFFGENEKKEEKGKTIARISIMLFRLRIWHIQMLRTTLAAFQGKIV
jgi:hypothetical protein